MGKGVLAVPVRRVAAALTITAHFSQRKTVARGNSSDKSDAAQIGFAQESAWVVRGDWL
jgi:hypothetical protein